MSSLLDPLDFPLTGSRLIEASAGTGKTWTIAALYLRLVLGHYGQARVPSEILVMTFTVAATRELSDRIRSRLLEAARCFRGEAQPQPGDDLLHGLMRDYPAGPARTEAAWRLSLAAESMDDAAVHTIDAWCQRMLREHAFDSGCLFDEELAPNETAMQNDAARDYWRQQVYPLHGDRLSRVLSVWSGVDALTNDVRSLLEQHLPHEAGRGTLDELLEGLEDDQGSGLAALKVDWSPRAKAMKNWLEAQFASKACPFDKRRLKKADWSRWLDLLAQWAEDPAIERPDLKAGECRLTAAGLRGARLPGAALEVPEDFEAFAGLMQALGRMQPSRATIRLHAAASIARRLIELKTQAGTFGFADMLRRLDDALDPAVNGANAARLRDRILKQYPTALIDEFQDTSPVQSRIFDRLYRIGENDPQTALLLIGDPKQAIYGFRGADIYSYLDAKRATGDRHYILGTNHRSTKALVDAVNHLFAQAEARPGRGAFMFRAADLPDATELDADQAVDDPVPFLPVKAHGRAESFVTSAGPRPAITLEIDDDLRSADLIMWDFAKRCAEHIVTLLNDPKAGFTAAGGFRRLQPADIAVLVRTGREADAVKRELQRRNVVSVYLSDSNSVFESPEARDLLHWLRAVASPRDVGLARAAFATRSAGLSIDELLVLASNDEVFDARSEQLRELHRIWQDQGVLTMLRHSLHRLDLPGRWLGARAGTAVADTPGDGQGDGQDVGQDDAEDVNGERKLTNYLHLAELLQTASAQLDGEQALIRWLGNQLDRHGVGDDEQIVRLESDADLVKIVTVHKAKGLEYPLVFLPFPANFREVAADDAFVVLPGEAGRRRVVLEPTLEQVSKADLERQREDLRLLYVAVTRARHALWVGLAALQKNRGPCLWHRSAIGYVLGGEEPVKPDALRARVEGLVASCADIVVTSALPAQEVRRSRLQPRDQPRALRDMPAYEADFDRRWSIGSFSALVRSLPTIGLGATALAAVRDDEALQPLLPGSGGDADRDAAAAALPPWKPWHQFPRGAVAGNFLHDQLEWLATESFRLGDSPELQQQLLRRCERHGWGNRGEELLAWLSKASSTPLPPLGVSLDSLSRLLPEMEFWFPSESLASGRVDALCRAGTLRGRDRPSLPERQLRGMLMGFADLVFEHGGRYWVLDYKSNHLGMTDADYGEDALERAMAVHRYDVQAVLYLLALHRLLRVRLGADYDPRRHLGGAIYFFLRGIEGPLHGCYLVPAEPALLDSLDALLRKVDEVGA